jgi:cytochrome c556
MNLLKPVFFILLASWAAISHADDQDVIAYRQHIMRTLNEQTAAVGEILSGAIPDDQAIAHLEAIALTASTAQKAFEPQVLGGESKADIWKDWADFSRRMSAFAQKAAEITKLAKDKGKEAALPTVLDALPCKSCHDLYRQEKKK